MTAKSTGSTSAISRGVLASVAILTGACGGRVGEVVIERKARLSARVVTTDSRAGVPCTATALLFGADGSQTRFLSGGSVEVVIGMATPLNPGAALKARTALRIECQGYRTVTTPDRDTDVAWVRSPTLGFGTIRVDPEE